MTVFFNKAATAIHRQRNRQKGGVNFVMVGCTDPSNSDNLNGDGGGCVRVRECVCACVCVHVCVRDVIVFATYNNNNIHIILKTEFYHAY